MKTMYGDLMGSIIYQKFEVTCDVTAVDDVLDRLNRLSGKVMINYPIFSDKGVTIPYWKCSIARKEVKHV